MSVLSSNINKICDLNRDSVFCNFLYGGSVIVISILALLLPYAIYEFVKSGEYKNIHWTSILAILSFFVFFYTLVGFGIWAYINNRLDESVDVVFLPLLGAVPAILRVYIQENGWFKSKEDEESILAKSKCTIIDQTLSSFGVNVDIVEIMINPSQFVYKLKLEDGYSRKDIKEYSEDLGMRLSSITGTVGWSTENCNDNEVLLLLPL